MKTVLKRPSFSVKTEWVPVETLPVTPSGVKEIAIDLETRDVFVVCLWLPVNGGAVGADQLERLGENAMRHQTLQPRCESSDILRIRFSLARVIPTYNTR